MALGVQCVPGKEITVRSEILGRVGVGREGRWEEGTYHTPGEKGEMGRWHNRLV